MELLSEPQTWVSFLTLAVLEIVLGIDNIIFLSLLVDRLPPAQRRSARVVGLGFAMLTRIALLFSVIWLANLREPLFAIAGVGISGRNLILFAGGAFLVVKSLMEIRDMLSGKKSRRTTGLMDNFWLIILQIGIIDIVFSLDTVFTAVGLANRVEVMIAAIVVSVLVMMMVSSAVERHHRAAPDHQGSGPRFHGAGGRLAGGGIRGRRDTAQLSVFCDGVLGRRGMDQYAFSRVKSRVRSTLGPRWVHDMNLKGMFATKPIDAYHKEAADKTLVRALGIPSLITFGIGGIIGTGIFVLTGLAAAQHAGPAIVISFIIAGIGCMFAGLCYSEFATMVPVAGSAYAYSYATLGEFVAWFVGWNLILEYMMACSTVAVGWSRYFVKLLDHFGINFIPDWLSSAPFEAAEVGFQVHRTSAYLNLPAIAIIAAATALCYKGIKESAWVNTIIVAIKVGIVIAVIAFGAVYVNTANWAPFIPENTGNFGEFGWSGILQASAIIFFAYIGFDGVSTVAQEAKNPQRDMPIGMLGSLAICTVLYILMSSVMTGLVPFKQLNDAAPVAVALESHPQLFWLSSWVIWGALFGLTSVIITMIIPQARIWLTMSQDGLLPKFFGAVHPKFRTPHIATLITGVLAATFAGTAADRHPRRAGVDRYAHRLHRRVSGGVGAALYAARFAPPVPSARGVVHLTHGRAVLRRHGRIAPHRDLGRGWCCGARSASSCISSTATETAGCARPRMPGRRRLRPPDRPRGTRAGEVRVGRALSAQGRGREGTDGLEQALVHLGISGHDVGAERVLHACRRADAPARLLDQQGAGGGIPRRQAEFPKAVDSARRHIGEIERGGARPAHARRGAHDDLEDLEIVIDVRRVHAIGKAGSDQRSFERALGADAYFPALELRAVAARGGEELLTHGIVDHRVLQAPAVLDRDRYGEGRKAVQEIRRAVERVDDPEVFARRRCGRSPRREMRDPGGCGE